VTKVRMPNVIQREKGRFRFFIGRAHFPDSRDPRWLWRHSEIRWVGKRCQWVLSPVHIALWTGKRLERRWYELCPLRSHR
jgi:hypothetical protein